MYKIDVDFGFKGSNSIQYKNVFLEFTNGDIINIIGENGSGKSSFYKVLMGQILPTRGDIPKEIKDNVVVVSDYVHIPNECNVKDVLDIIKDDSINYLKDSFPSLYDSVIKIIDKKVSTLSSGEKRILEIFCALSTRKKILILDEASNGLDIYNRQILINQIKKLSETKSISVFNTTHHFEDIVDLGGSILYLNKRKKTIDKFSGPMELSEIIKFMKEAEIE